MKRAKISSPQGAYSGCWNIAHRGYSSKFPENTLSAFHAACDLKAQMIEFDVTFTKDLVPVVIHDITLNRTTNGRGRVRDWNYSELQKLDAGSWFHPKFSSEKIPTLMEVLDIFGARVSLNIEIKREAILDQEKLSLETVVLREIRKRKLEHSIVVSSFDHACIDRLLLKAPEIITAYLFTKSPKKKVLDHCAKQGVEGIHVAKRTVRRRLIREIHARGMSSRIYTVNDPREMQRFIQLNASGLFTDHPNRFPV